MDKDLIALGQISSACLVFTAAIRYTASKMGFTKYIQKIGNRNYLPQQYADQIIEFYHEKQSDQDSYDRELTSRKINDGTSPITITLNSDDLAMIKRLTPSPFSSVSDYCRRLVHADIKVNGSKYERIVALRKETETEIESLIRDLGFSD